MTYRGWLLLKFVHFVAFGVLLLWGSSYGPTAHDELILAAVGLGSLVYAPSVLLDYFSDHALEKELEQK